MAIKIIMAIYILILLLTAGYMWRNRKKHFLIYSAATNTNFTGIITSTAASLVLESILGIVLLFFTNKYLNLITLALSCCTILIFGLLINQNNS